MKQLELFDQYDRVDSLVELDRIEDSLNHYQLHSTCACCGEDMIAEAFEILKVLGEILDEGMPRLAEYMRADHPTQQDIDAVGRFLHTVAGCFATELPQIARVVSIA